jgi:hypothetical protein
MDSGFHIANLTTKSNPAAYQPYRAQTIGPIPVLLAALLCSLYAGAQPPPNAQGFAPPEQNLLAPLLLLAPPGQADQALHSFDQIHELDRKLILHPAVSPQLQSLLDRLPAAEVIPIEIPTLYASPDIPWRSDPPHARYIAFEGKPSGADYIYGLAQTLDPPTEPGLTQGALTLVEPPGGPQPAESDVAKLKGSLYLSDTMTPSRGMDAALGFGREIRGTLAPPWDSRPGIFNQHDRAALAELRRDLPATSDRLEIILRFTTCSTNSVVLQDRGCCSISTPR